MSSHHRLAAFNACALAALTVSLTSLASAATPATQTAVVQRGVGGTEVLNLETIPVREPGEGQVLIQVYAAGVNPVDWKSREGVNGRRFGTPAPARATPPARIPGSEAAGVVARVGGGVMDFKVGDAVAGGIGGGIDGLNGGYSSYALANASRLIPKPKSLTYAEAAGLGTASNTAALAVFRLKIQAGQTLLITGIAGGVGSSVAQMAKARGARVVGTASGRHAAFLKSIGVDEVLDYTQGDWTTRVRNVDLVLDTVGGMSGEQALGVLKKGGQFMGINTENGEPTAEQCAAAGVELVALRPSRPGDPTERELMAEVGKLADAGKFRIHVDRAFPLEQAAAAQELSREGHTEGKIVLVTDAALAGRK